jgi:hypothetical protein
MRPYAVEQPPPPKGAMIRSETELLVPLRTAGAIVPRPQGARAPHEATVKRWASHGIRGVQLETIRIGGSVYTSREALARFIERTNAVAVAAGSGFDSRRQEGGAA